MKSPRSCPTAHLGLTWSILVATAIAVTLLQALTGCEVEVMPLDPNDTRPVKLRITDVVGYGLAPFSVFAALGERSSVPCWRMFSVTILG